MVSIAPPYYVLHSASQLKWMATQEKTLSREYPFVNLHAETPEQYVQRTYLQFLWLPESIMPLHLLVPSMLRVNVASSSQSPPITPHPLHALLDQLLLSVRSSSNKYHVELPQILSDGGGAGEVEENMMWFTLNHEKVGRTEWLDRMERREIQIQILLHLLKISLPGPCPPDSEPTSPTKKRRHPKHEPKFAMPTTEERLESFMDKLSTWQLLGTLSTIVPDRSTLRTSSGPVKDDRDWMQVFCEDLVETQFKSKLPELCALFRTKIFPYSPFSDGPSSDTLPSAAAFPRSRSRSLSASLAQDADTWRAGSVGAGVVTKRRTLNREVSMSRVFKDKPVKKGDGSKTKLTSKGTPDLKSQSQMDQGVTLVMATPVKGPRRAQLQPAELLASTTGKF